MFHAARALLYSKGYREKSPYCLIVARKALFAEEGLLDVGLIEAFQTAKVLRENADYENEFSGESARALVSKAGFFLATAQKILNIKAIISAISLYLFYRGQMNEILPRRTLV
mgnify:CR=1 FL=1